MPGLLHGRRVGCSGFGTRLTLLLHQMQLQALQKQGKTLSNPFFFMLRLLNQWNNLLLTKDPGFSLLHLFSGSCSNGDGVLVQLEVLCPIK